MTDANGARFAAWVFAALSAVVMLFHVAAICGAPVGYLTMGGRWPGVLPPAARLLSALSLGTIALTATVVLARAGVITRTLPRWSMRAVLGYLALAIPMHIATPSSAERHLWLPVILVLTASALWVELRAGGATARTRDIYYRESLETQGMEVDVQTAIVIERPVAEVAAYAADPDNVPRWYVNIKSVEWKSPRPAVVGSEVAFVATFLGRRLEYTYHIAEWVPGERLVMRTAEGPFPMETTYTWVATTDGGTRMTLRNRGTPRGFSALFSPFMAWAVRNANRKDLAALKGLLERQPPGGR